MRNRLNILTYVAFGIIWFSQPAPAEAGAVKWNAIVGASTEKLTSEQRAQVTKNLTTLQNTHGCNGTLAACTAKGDMTARRHAGFVVRAVQKGKDNDYIAKHIALRHASAHPKRTATFDLADRPMRGAPDAPVSLVTFECFQCPFCAFLSPKTQVLHKAFNGKIKEYFKFFPVRSHPRGVPAAVAGLAAHKQGKFWPMQKLLFKNRAKLEDDDILKYAKSSGLNMEQFKKDIKDTKLMKAIEKDKLEGMRFGVDGTPTFFINGKRYQAAYDIEEIKDRIAEELDIIEGRIPE